MSLSLSKYNIVEEINKAEIKLKAHYLMWQTGITSLCSFPFLVFSLNIKSKTLKIFSLVDITTVWYASAHTRTFPVCHDWMTIKYAFRKLFVFRLITFISLNIFIFIRIWNLNQMTPITCLQWGTHTSFCTTTNSYESKNHTWKIMPWN